MAFSTLGNEFAKRVFANVITKRALAPLYLLEGPRGVGKATLAHQVAAALLCENPVEKPCGKCDACRKVAGFSHPDLKILLPEKASAPVPGSSIRPKDFSTNQRITIAQIRQITQEANSPPMEGKIRVIIVLDGDLMTPEAQNAFLKTLEETGSNRSFQNTFLMVSAFPERLLNTVRSRARRVRFYNLSLQEFSGYDFRDPPLPVPVLHRLSGGSIGLAKRFAGPELRRLRKMALATLLQDVDSLAEAVSSIRGDRDAVATFLTLLTFLIRDAMVIHHGLSDSVVNLDLAEDLKQVAERLNLEQLDQLLLDVAFAEEAILQRYLPADAVLLTTIRALFPKTYLDTVRL